MTTSDSWLNARFEIERLVYGYAACVDAGDFNGVAELFTNGRIIAPNGAVLAAGYEEIRAFYQDTVRLYAPTNTPLTQHIISNLVLDIDANKARTSGASNFTVFQKTDAGPLEPIICGRYEDVFEKIDGSWQFRQRRAVPLLVGDLSRHLLRFA